MKQDEGSPTNADDLSRVPALGEGAPGPQPKKPADPDGTPDYDKLYDDHISFRDKLIDLSKEAGSRYTNLISALSAGSLALSVTFVRFIAPELSLLQQGVLVVVWLFLGASLLLNVSSVLLSQHAILDQIELIDDHISSAVEHNWETAAAASKWRQPVLWLSRFSEYPTESG